MSPLTYAEFGDAFIRLALTPERICDELTALLGEPIDGSVSKLPAEMLVGNYTFTLKNVVVQSINPPPAPVRFRIRINGVLALKVKIVGIPLRFTLDVHIQIHQTVKTVAPVIIVLENEEITRDDVTIDVDAHEVPGDLLDKLNIVEPAVKDQVVDEVNARIRSGEIAEACTIDVLRLAQSAVIGRPPPDAAHMQS